MRRTHSFLAVIPARGGSKSIPKKNIIPLAEKPLIYYTIEEAKKSKYIDRIIVSTDDQKIAEISKGFGAEVIMRPSEFGTDTARTELAVIHVVETLKNTEGYEADIVVTLEPTSPLRTHQLIDRCIEKLMTADADSVIAVVETSSLVGRVIDGRFEYLIKNQPRRRQDREPLYKESSAVYVTKTETLLGMQSVLGQKLYAVIADRGEAIDINTPLDFVIAEAVLGRK
ncbi:MAG: acylneuraminate cytidylyltransferase family protein [Candidatus Brocadiales bacterium]|nr:acylneuraminate cytidylyltransferase family protein [Candidatus Bathyanammoxibius sp.]